MAFQRFFKYILPFLLLPLSLSAQTVVRAGTQGTSWTVGMSCALGTIVTANPDNLHAFKAINAVTGTAGGTQPAWNLQPGSLTTDGTCSWMENGTSGLGGASVVTIPPSATVATLPIVHTPGQIVAVIDGTTPNDCIVGGGTNVVDCFWNGIAWGQLGNTLSFPWTLGQGGTGTTTPCSTTNAVAVFGASSLGCGSTLLWDGTKLTVGTPGTGYIGVPQGASNPCIANLSNSYYCLWMNSGSGQLNCYRLVDGLSCFPAGSVSGTVGNVVNIGGGNVPADAGFLSSNVVRKDSTNIGAAGMTLDLSASSLFRAPNAASGTASQAGQIVYDTTNKNLHGGANGVDNIFAIFPASASITSGDCTGWSVVAGVTVLTDAGACGGGGGGGGTSQLFTTINGGASGCIGNVCTGNTADQVIYTFSVGNPGNGKCVDVNGWWRNTTSSGASKVIRVKLGSTAFSFNTFTVNTSVQAQMSMRICNIQGSHTSQIAVQNQPLFANATAAVMNVPGTASIDWSSGAQTIQIIQNATASEVLTWDMGQVVTLP